MPTFTFRCADCEASRDLLIDLGTAEAIDLICTSCGASMKRAPVLALNVIGAAAAARRSSRAAEAERLLTKACGHSHRCRCSVTLSKPNPFGGQIKRAAGFVDDD